MTRKSPAAKLLESSGVKDAFAPTPASPNPDMTQKIKVLLVDDHAVVRQGLRMLLEAETDTDLKVDLIDSLLGIEGHTEEKLAMLTQGARSGLPKEVRLSAVDGLIELNDPRTVAVFNGMLNDPDEEIREAAKDALEMLQAQPPVQLK